MTMPAPIPNREAESNAERNPYWPSYEEDLAGYGGHLVVAGMRQRAEGVEPTRADALQVHLAHAEVLNALVDYPGAIGIYSGNQEIEGVGAHTPSGFDPRWWDRLAASLRDADSPAAP